MACVLRETKRTSGHLFQNKLNRVSSEEIFNFYSFNSEKTRSELASFIQKLKQNQNLAHKVPQVVKWYPQEDTVYSFNEMGRAELRHTPELKEFHRFIVTETETGRLFRQEKVSMIPVTLLNPKPGEKVLDMCAAPGSKTIQILEYLH